MSHADFVHLHLHTEYSLLDVACRLVRLIDKEILAQINQGLIALSGCLASEIPDLMQPDQLDKARATVDWFKQTFGAENFYLELQNHTIPEQINVNRHLIQWAGEFGLKLVATNDVHYVEKGDSHAHDALICIGTQSLLSDSKRMRYVPEQFYLRSAEEMKAIFAEVPDAVRNTLEVAEKCNLEIEFGKLHYPVFHPPESFTREGYLRKLLAEGLWARYRIRARSEGETFIVEGIEDARVLPTFPSEAPTAKTPPSQNGKPSGNGIAAVSPDPLPPENDLSKPSVAAAVKTVIDRLDL